MVKMLFNNALCKLLISTTFEFARLGKILLQHHTLLVFSASCLIHYKVWSYGLLTAYLLSCSTSAPKCIYKPLINIYKYRFNGL